MGLKPRKCSTRGCEHPARPERVQCAECAALQRRSFLAHKEAREAFHTRYMASARERWRADGLCAQCGRARVGGPKGGGHWKLCKRCRDYRAAYKRRHGAPCSEPKP